MQLARLTSLPAFLFSLIAPLLGAADDGKGTTALFRAGAATVDITPKTFPRIIAGGFLEGRGVKVTDPLFVRSFVLDDGKMKIAFAIVDTCMMEQSLIDEAKAIASKQCGIPVDHMMVSATHTHAAPAAMGCLGTRKDTEYAAFLTPKIAEAIVAADKALQPAQIGWGSVDDWEHTHNRRWIRLPGKEVVDPFGQSTGRANMHPGYLSKDVVGPSGPVDPQLSVISVQTPDGKPIAVLANYSQHYFGAAAVSADYYGLFCKHLAAKMGQPGDGNGPFVCAMSQGTSGDQMWMDYGAEKKNLTLDTYASAVADSAMKALQTVKYHKHVPLGMVEKTILVGYRVPDEDRLAWARPIAAKIENDVPKDKQEVYAREALILHERQKTRVKLQAIRIGSPETGELGIATLPNEVYAVTGLQLRWSSPYDAHFNIELANGAEGYIPPREQHGLGGYTTWPARTAGLEVGAELRIYRTLRTMLRQLNLLPGRGMSEDAPPYALEVIRSDVDLFLDFQKGVSDLLAYQTGSKTVVRGGHALYLPGFNAGRGYGDESALKPEEVQYPKDKINRSIHLAGGHLETTKLKLGTSFSIGLWFWLGHESGASNRSGSLIGDVILRQNDKHRVTIAVGHKESAEIGYADDWHFAVLVQDKDEVNIYVDGGKTPVLTVPSSGSPEELLIGEGLEGRLDEITVWKRAIEPSLIAKLWEISKVGETNARHLTERKAKEQEAARREQQTTPLQSMEWIAFAKDYEKVVFSLKHIFGIRSDSGIADANRTSATLGYSPQLAKVVIGGALDGRAKMKELGARWSVSLWFRSDMPNDARPVTAYLMSRGPKGNREAPGDHLGIGGTYKGEYTGKLIVFNGNDSNQVVSGSTTVVPGSWNHVVLVRDGGHVRGWLNGADKPEFDEELPVTAAEAKSIFFGARCDDFAPLKGYIARWDLFDGALTAADAKQLFTAAGVTTVAAKTSVAPPALASSLQLSSPPLSPEESLKKWHVRDGYKIELVAAEPVVLDPVAFDWDEQGRLWVVEMADYPLGMDGKGKPGGRVVMLEDTNDDAKYDKRTVIADGLNFPTGILTWREGAIVTAAPDVLYIGPTGEKKVLLTGFSTGNQQLRVNGLRWGMDGWVYCAAGAHNAGYNKGTEITSVLTGEKITLGSRDFRFKPDTGEFDPQSGPSQFGRARDDWGHWFGVQNSFPLWHYVLQDHYLRRNPHVIPPDPIQQLFPRNPKVYPVSSMEKRFHSFGESGRFTSACGIEVYRDRVLFDDGKTHAFTCEPFHNVVQHHVLEDDGVTFKATRDPAESKHDFLASEDRWCRPVMVRTGPDGALWIADMYRYMIEHPQWLPQNGKDELLPHYREGDDKGRIWRVTRPAGLSDSLVHVFARLFEKQEHSTHSPLDSTNGWVRDKGQMVNQWRPGKVAFTGAAFHAGEEPEKAILKYPEVRAQAAWTMLLMRALDFRDLSVILKDPSPRVREQALQIAERFDGPKDAAAFHEALAKLAEDPDPKVRLQLACSLGAFPDEWAADLLARLLSEAPPGSPLAGAAMSSVLPHLERVCQTFPEGGEPHNNGAIRALLHCALRTKNDKAIEALTPAFEARYLLPDVLDVLDENGLSLTQFASQVKAPAARARVMKAQEAMAQALEAVRKSDATLLGQIELLASDRANRAEIEGMLGQVWKQAPPEIASSWLPWITRLQPKDAPEFLLTNWSGRTPALRTQIIETLLSNDTWALALLQRVESKQVETNAFDAAARARLTKHPKAEVKKLAATVFTDSGSAARAAVLEKFKPALQLKGDPAKGKEAFALACISCHKLDNAGLELGPDLRSVAQHDPDKLLNSILDPSAIIEPGFMAYHCTLKSGEQLYGIIATETSTSLTLKLPGNITRSVLRSDVASLKSTSLSLMPDGLEAALTPQSLADLIAYLKMPRN